MLGTFIQKQREKFKYYDSITGMSEILRRYFVMNAFDGALTILGVLLGSFIADIDNPVFVLKIGIATSIAVGISGLTGAMFAERAERKREIRAMEDALHRKLDNTEMKAAYDTASTLIALVDGISPLLASMFILLPFFFFSVADVHLAYQVSMCLALVVFFLLGMFLGRISKESLFFTGIKLVMAGLVCMLFIFLLEGL
ncbi:MAG: hypothetical protein ABII71_05275 [Candidatus Micrarchaeota archaeon]